MATPRPVTHISREEIYTDLEKRIEYLQSFLDFSSRDVNALVADAKYIKALIPAVVNIVHKKLLQYDITARAFQTRRTSVKGPLGDVPAEQSSQILHRKIFLHWYLNKLCSDPTKMEFWEYLDKVGQDDARGTRPHSPPTHRVDLPWGLPLLDPRHHDRSHSLSPQTSSPRKITLVKALGKIIWIQNDLMAKWHIREGVDEFAVNDDEIEVEEEGYLHGKKIVNNEEGDAENPGTPTGTAPAGACPFSGLGEGTENMNIEAHDFA